MLRPEIIKYIHKKTKKKESTIRSDISRLRRSYGSLSINAVAQLYALQNRTSVLTKLTKEEKNSLPNLRIEKSVILSQKTPKEFKGRKIISYVTYQTTDPFINAHIFETNKTYTYGCYTATFILCRKIIENLLTDIIRKKYPPKKKSNVELYFDTSTGRTKDFSVILSNLNKCSQDFGPDKTLLQRIISYSKPFKDDANDKTHSWYHIVKSKKELDQHNIQDILDMIGKLDANMGSSV